MLKLHVSIGKYEKCIAERFLKKISQRELRTIVSNRKSFIRVKPTDIISNYYENNVNIQEKDLLNEAFLNLEKLGFIKIIKQSFTDDVMKAVLIEENIKFFKQYADSELGLEVYSYSVNKLNDILKSYRGKGPLVEFYTELLSNQLSSSLKTINIQQEEDLLKILDFLDNNKEALYVREISMLVYGTSKYLEDYVLCKLKKILSLYLNKNEELVFDYFNILNVDQQICFKGPMTITIKDTTVDVEKLNLGFTMSEKQINNISNIYIKTDSFFTVENKTSYLRMPDSICTFYLGGFANKSQIAFLKLIRNYNPVLKFYHFGDIDAGGFYIHHDLCKETGINFTMFHMGVDDLLNDNYKYCLQKLSDNDVNRLQSLKDMDLYRECVKYMINNNIKLEQEIISYYLFR